MESRSWLTALAGSLMLVAGVSGCGSEADDSRVEVSGTVSLDGAPLEKGLITLMPVDGKGPSAGATIEGGKFTTRITPGEKRVRISSQEVVGERPRDPNDPEGPQIEDVKERIPERYNTKSELTITIGPDGKDDADFPLKSS